VIVRGEISGPKSQGESLGVSLANQLLDEGAREILTRLYEQES
jgi:hydroxymethylbilane synthase